MRRTVILFVSMALSMLSACGVAVAQASLQSSSVFAKSRRLLKGTTLMVCLALGLGVVLTASQTNSSLAQTAPRPNILFILTDDMRASDLRYMPKTRELLAGRGVRFANAFVSNSLCCPSRATTLRGQYTHNHQIWTNVSPEGGFHKFREQGFESSTIATWLNDPTGFDDGGYDTILIGKYLNGYDDTTHVPPGWDRWHGFLGNYNVPTTYQINENGRITTYERSRKHDTDLYSDKAARFIRYTAGGAPFFMYLATNAPHTPAYSPQRHAGMFSSTPLPKPPSFDEANVSDKPAWVSSKPRLTSSRVDRLQGLYRKRLRSLQSVDEMVGRLVTVLGNTGELSNTYIVFTSDNGFHLGEHRLEGKQTPYQEAIRVPLLVRGPGVPVGTTRSQMVLNNDLAPTFADFSGVTPPEFVDGRSLKPLLSATPPAAWRNAFLVEHEAGGGIPGYAAVRLDNRLYVEYETGEKELYDLSADPYQLTSRHASADPTLLSNLEARLEMLKGCAEGACKTAEGGG